MPELKLGPTYDMFGSYVRYVRFRTMRLRVPFTVMLASALVAAAFVAASVDPWTDSETLTPPVLVKMLEGGEKLAIAYTGPLVLHRAGRIAGATLIGPTSEAEGLADLKRWARKLPRAETLVIYCGCCPMEKCPNIRPAYRTLREMGFTNLRVLVLATSFEKDWIGKGFPIER
jgi:thiosulfate/3-mercaptopyruvate sulfurtransferase